MGRNKELLPIDGHALVERTAGNVKLIGALERYWHRGQAMVPVYHRRAQGAVEFAIQHKRFKTHDLNQLLKASSWPAREAPVLENVNTPLESGSR
jgi:molybdopterin-guanine dinucleotide biosynthesis protein A